MALFTSLSEKMSHIFSKLTKRGKLTELEIKEAMREVKLALLEADVNYLVVKDFIKKLALEEFTARSQKVADQIGKTVHNVCIKDTKSRWASCSTLNNINYSWRLALAPDFVIRYIVAHEVSHLKHQDHSPYFWALVEFLDEDAARGREWLTENGHLLYMYK